MEEKKEGRGRKGRRKMEEEEKRINIRERMEREDRKRTGKVEDRIGGKEKETKEREERVR